MVNHKIFVTIHLLLSLLLILPGPAAAEPRPVGVRELGEIAIFPRRSAPATVVSLNDSLLSAEIRARIERISVLVGQEVAKGQTLVEFACQDYRFALQAAEAARVLALAQNERALLLEEQKVMPRELSEQRRAELAAASAARDRAALDVERCRLTAPFAGVVMARLASEGEYADIGAPLLRLLAAHNLEVVAQVPLDGIASLATAADLYLETDDQRFLLRNRILLPAVNSEARNREARLTFNGPRALPGSAGRLVWQSSRPHLPADLVGRREAGLGVFVADQDRARFVLLPAAREGHPAALDLPATTPIIIEGRHGLRDGDPISINAGTR